MIAAIEWVPAGVAAEAPKKYEMNATEREVLQMLQEQQEGGAENYAASVAAKLPKVDGSELPADLRMDEYSDDEQEGPAIGNLLVDEEDVSVHEEPEMDDAKTDGNVGDANDDMDSSDSDDDGEDNLEDVPDTREFTPIDVEGLEAMGLGEGAVGDASNLFVDDDSEAEETRISKTDAVLIVAKTEEVRLPESCANCDAWLCVISKLDIKGLCLPGG